MCILVGLKQIMFELTLIKKFIKTHHLNVVRPCEILPWGPMNPQIFKNLYLFPWKDLQNVFWSKSLSMGSLKIHMERALDPRQYLPRALLFLAATKQLYKWYFPSVCLSHLFDYVPIIVSSWNFQELLPMTKVRSMQKVKVKVTEVTTQLNRFRTVTPV